MADTVDRIAHQVLLHCPLAGKPLATLWVVNAWAKLADARDLWSWRTKYGQIAIPASYSTGTISITSADPTLVIGSSTVWTQAMVGRQIRSGNSFGYDIVEWIDVTHIRIGLPWADADLSAATYTILQQYVTMPEDFAGWLSVVDLTRNQRLRTGVERREIDRRDPRRSTTGTPWALAEAGSSPAYQGTVDTTPFQVSGSGSVPTFGGAYSGAVDTIYTVEITTTGLGGAAVFKWKRGTGAYTTGVTADVGGVGLSGNVVVNFSDTITYTSGDIFVSRAKAAASFGNMRFEIWPIPTVQSTYQYYYLTQPPDISWAGATLPRSIRADVLLKGAMAECCAWAGRGAERNPLYDLKAAAKNIAEFERQTDILALRDDEMVPRDVTYFRELPIAGPIWDASWEQSHA